MGRRALTQADYELMIEGFREDAPNYRPHTVRKFLLEAHKQTFHAKTLKRAWDHGWPEKGWDPVPEIFRREEEAARVRLLQEERDKRRAQEAHFKDLEEQGSKSRQEEGKMVQHARTSSIRGLRATEKLADIAGDLATEACNRVAAELEASREAAEDDNSEGVVSSRDLLAKMTTIAKLTADIVKTAKTAMDMGAAAPWRS